jgi:hypothetical protein
MRTITDLRERNLSDFLRQAAVVVSIGAALIQFARFLFIALSRIAYPFSLEWMEGGSLVQVSRILNGKLIYVRPSFDFIPQIYPPLYFYVSALVSKILGNSFLPLRFVSILATLGTILLIFVLVYEQTGSKLGGILASGLFCATYELSGYWFDLARVDSLALVLLLLAAYLLLKNTRSASIFGGILLALSCFTKQTMLIVAVFFLIYCIFPLRKNNLIFIGTALISFIGGILLLDRLHGGWYSYYIFHLPGRHRIIPNFLNLISSTNDIFFEEMVKPVFFALTIGLLYLLIFPGKADSTEGQAAGSTWSKRVVWALIFVVGLSALSSIGFLVSLPSDSGGIIGSYSLARLLLIAGQAFIGLLVLTLAIKLLRDASWLDKVARLLFGKPQTIPRLLVGCIILIFLSAIVLARTAPAVLSNLSAAYLQRLLPYLIEPLVLLIVVGFAWRFLWPSTRLEPWFYLLLSLGLIATSWLGRLNPGGYNNAFMPADAGIALLFGLGIGWLLKRISINKTAFANILSAFLLLLSSTQLIVLLSPPMAQIPTQADKEAGLQLVDRIKACPGNVYIPFHTYLAELAGKDGYAGVVEMGELRGNFGGKADPLWDEVLSQIQLSLDTHTFAAVIQDNQVFRDAISSSYVETGQVFDNDLVFWPVAGRKVRPETVYVPVGVGNCFSTGK